MNLEHAIIARDTDLVARLLKAGANPDGFTRCEGYAAPLLVLAATKGNARIVELLLEHGAGPDGETIEHDRFGDEMLDRAGRTAIELAARDGHVDIVAMLQGRGASLGEALHRAAEMGRTTVVRYLLEHGADPNREGGGATPLDLAIRAKRRRVVELLRPRMSQAYWDARVLRAAASGNVAYLRRALQRGHIEGRDRGAGGETPLVYAARYGRLRAVQLLVELGADVEARTTDGSTAISEAQLRGHEEVVRWLAEHRAGGSTRNNPRPARTRS